MYFLFSGEGPTDLGVGTGAAMICEGDEYQCGPMAIIIDQIVESHPRHRYSPLDSRCCGCVSEHHLADRAGELKAARKSLGLPGVKQPKETRYFFNNARILARVAREKQVSLGDEVVAVLFRDCDGTASAGRGLWDDKHTSMLHGFQEEGFGRGVPMLPKPKSEAWIIAGMTGNVNHGGRNLEDWSGNDKSPNSLKGELEKILDGYPSAETQCEMVRNRQVDFEKIKLPSFTTFKNRLVGVI
jgi:hypothetical protein